jgi:hypothetical protein
MTKNSGQVKSILDRSFRYTPSHETDLRKTFAKIRREQRLQERAKVQAPAEARVRVSPICLALYPAQVARRESVPEPSGVVDRWRR